jgi:predicted nucleotide-binding protein
MMATKVFVSYVRSDTALAEQLFRTLHTMPVEVWSDDQLTAGDNWSEVLRSRIRESQFFVLLLSPKTLESSWVHQELGAAWALGKQIVAVVTDRHLVDKLPVDIKGVQTLNVSEMEKLEDIFQRVA